MKDPRKAIELDPKLTVRELHQTLVKFRKRGFKPYLKGTKGTVKLEFE